MRMSKLEQTGNLSEILEPIIYIVQNDRPRVQAMMLRFIPYTVVAGFLAGSGILILQAGQVIQ